MKIAIQGHPTRGKEVIQLLESLGGINRMNHSGCYTNYFYYISGNDNTITWTCIRPQHINVFTLEEIEKELPFKIGDKVIILDYNNKKGTIIDIERCGPILSYFIKLETGKGIYRSPRFIKLYKEMKEERNITLTLEKAKEWYKKGGELKEIALQAFTEKELTKVELPKTWEEFCENYPIKDGVSYIDISSNIRVTYSYDNSFRSKTGDKNLCPSERSAEAHLAMIQLEQLRDCWRQGWKPKEHEPVYTIKFSIRGLSVYQFNSREFLSFPTKEMAEEFLKCFRDLIEKAGDLI